MILWDCVCGRALKAPDKLSGKVSRCPACATELVVPPPAAAADEPEEYSLSSEPPVARVYSSFPEVVPAFLPPGKYTVQVTAEDVAHNIGTAGVALEIW